MLAGILVDPGARQPVRGSDGGAGTPARHADGDDEPAHDQRHGTADEAGRAHLGLRPRRPARGRRRRTSRERTARELRAAYGERALYSSDLRVGTTLDLDLQTAVDAALAGLPARTGPVAVAAVDPRDGGVRALGHIGSKLGATPADGLLEPVPTRRAARRRRGRRPRRDGGVACRRHRCPVRGPRVRDARRRRPTSPAPGRAVRDPAGGGVRAIGASAPGSAGRVVGPGPSRPRVTDQVRGLLMSTPLPGGRPGGGAAVPAAGRCVARRCSSVAPCRCAWPCKPAPGRLRRAARPGAGGVRPGLGRST